MKAISPTIYVSKIDSEVVREGGGYKNCRTLTPETGLHPASSVCLSLG